VDIYTIGHSNVEIAQFLHALRNHGITLVVDARTSPYSRFVPWANRESLNAADATARVPDLVRTLELSQERRLNDLFAYLASTGCRHARIAQHFGVRAPDRCAMCDRCAPQPEGPPGRLTGVSKPTPSRARADHDPTYILLQCLQGLPFRPGWTGLSRILIGSLIMPLRPHESEWYGALEGWPRKRVDALIEAAIDAGYLDRDDSEYRRLSVTAIGRALGPKPDSSTPPPQGSSSSREGVSHLLPTRQIYPDAYALWSADEDASLRDEHERGTNIAEIARRHGRQPSAIFSRLRKLGYRV
jgi:hypothetical protein